MACERLGQFADAELAYQKIITLRPAFAEAHCNLGGVLLKLQRWAEAEASFAKAIALKAAFPEALNGLGVARKQLGNLAGAAEALQSALAQKPAYAEALFNLANTFQAQENWAEAVRTYQKVLALNPRSIDALHNLACAQIGQRAFAEAVASLERVIAQQPENADAFNHLGNAQLGLNRFADAARAYERALALRAGFVDARCNLANVHLAQNQPEEAQKHLRAAARLGGAAANLNRGTTQLNGVMTQLDGPPAKSASIEFNLSIALLVSGQWHEGFGKYERRWDTEQKAFRKQFSAPLWLGRESLAGQTILLWSEQGIGDTLQFVRYAPALAERGAIVLLQVQAPLKALLENFPGVTRVYSKTESPEHFDFQCPLGSLPLALGIEVDAIGTTAPYIFCDPAKRSSWAEKLKKTPTDWTGSAGASPASASASQSTLELSRIGLVCSGNARHKNDQNRSIPLSAFAEIARNVGAPLHVTQKDLRSSDGEFLAQHPDLFTNWSETLNDFTDTAALIDNLDLVITVDTSVAHLAGAMGKPTWILLPFAPDWRWLLNREDTPWYPTVRLFRQKAPDDWRGALQALGEALPHPKLSSQPRFLKRGI